MYARTLLTMLAVLEEPVLEEPGPLEVLAITRVAVLLMCIFCTNCSVSRYRRYRRYQLLLHIFYQQLHG